MSKKLLLMSYFRENPNKGAIFWATESKNFITVGIYYCTQCLTSFMTSYILIIRICTVDKGLCFPSLEFQLAMFFDCNHKPIFVSTCVCLLLNKLLNSLVCGGKWNMKRLYERKSRLCIYYVLHLWTRAKL